MVDIVEIKKLCEGMKLVEYQTLDDPKEAIGKEGSAQHSGSKNVSGGLEVPYIPRLGPLAGLLSRWISSR